MSTKLAKYGLAKSTWKRSIGAIIPELMLLSKRA